MLEKIGTWEREPNYMTKPSSLRKRISENAEPLTEGAQSQTASVLAVLIEQLATSRWAIIFTEYFKIWPMD